MLYEIHEVTEENITRISSTKNDDILVFDDGLFSQYYYFDKIKKINNVKYFAISANLVLDYQSNQLADINRNKAMWLYKEQRIKSAYMTVEQINHIISTDNCHLCAHGFNHLKFEQYIKKSKDLKFLTSEFINDFNKSLEWYKSKLNIIPTAYCFPYNYTFEGFLKKIVESEFKFIKIIFEKRKNTIIINIILVVNKKLLNL